VDNLFVDVPAHAPDEVVDVLVRTSTARLERIVSMAHRTPPSQW
jgi:hypothetical protein